MELNQRYSLVNFFPLDRGSRREFFRNFLIQVYFTFVQAIPIAAFIGILLGLLGAYQMRLGLAVLGSYERVIGFLVVVLFREVIPLGAALLLTARSISAVSSELATNKVQSEIEAYEVMGVNVCEFLLAPRIWGGAVSMICVALVFWMFCLVGTWISLNLTANLPLGVFFHHIASGITVADIIFFFLKTTTTGVAVFWIACARGLQFGHAAFQIPQATTKAVIDGITAAFVIQVALSGLFYMIFGLQV